MSTPELEVELSRLGSRVTAAGRLALGGLCFGSAELLPPFATALLILAGALTSHSGCHLATVYAKYDKTDPLEIGLDSL